MPHDMMYSCEEKRPFMQDGQKVLRWKVVEVTSLDSGQAPYIRCMHCHGRVRVHKQKVEHGPKDHVEHVISADSRRCRGGYHFKGTHQRSAEPVE